MHGSSAEMENKSTTGCPWITTKEDLVIVIAMTSMMKRNAMDLKRYLE